MKKCFLFPLFLVIACAQAPISSKTTTGIEEKIPLKTTPATTGDSQRSSTSDEKSTNSNDTAKVKSTKEEGLTASTEKTAMPTTKSDVTVKPTATPNPGNDTGSGVSLFSYKIEYPSCTTGEHKMQKNEICLNLLDDLKNNNCGRSDRDDIHNKFCVQNKSWKDALGI